MRRAIIIVTLLTILFGCGAAEARKANAYLSCESYSIRDYLNRGDYDLISIMKLMKSLGIQGVAVNDIYMKSFDKPYLDQIKNAAKENGITISALICDGSIIGNDEYDRKMQIGVYRERLYTAAYLGAPVVRLNIGGSGASKDESVGIKRAISGFKELLPTAKELKLKLVIENHWGVTGKADNIIRIIQATDPKYVGSCVDFANWPDPATMYDEMAKVIPYAYHVHAKSHEFDANGEDTTVDYGRVLKMIRASGYRGAISIEFEGKGDQIEGVKKTRDLILKHWKM